MKYGIIGTGAIGGYYGAKLAHISTPAPWRLPASQDAQCLNWRCWRQNCGSWRRILRYRSIDDFGDQVENCDLGNI